MIATNANVNEIIVSVELPENTNDVAMKNSKLNKEENPRDRMQCEKNKRKKNKIKK